MRFFLVLSLLFVAMPRAQANTTQEFEAYCTVFDDQSTYAIKSIKNKVYSIRNEKKQDCLFKKSDGTNTVALTSLNDSCQLPIKKIMFHASDLSQDKLSAEVHSSSAQPQIATCRVVFKHADIKCHTPNELKAKLIKTTYKIINTLESNKLIGIDGEAIQCSCRQSACTEKEAKPCSAPKYTCGAGVGSGISLHYDHDLKFTGASTWER